MRSRRLDRLESSVGPLRLGELGVLRGSIKPGGPRRTCWNSSLEYLCRPQGPVPLGRAVAPGAIIAFRGHVSCKYVY